MTNRRVAVSGPRSASAARSCDLVGRDSRPWSLARRWRWTRRPGRRRGGSFSWQGSAPAV